MTNDSIAIDGGIARGFPDPYNDFRREVIIGFFKTHSFSGIRRLIFTDCCWYIPNVFTTLKEERQDGEAHKLTVLPYFRTLDLLVVLIPGLYGAPVRIGRM